MSAYTKLFPFIKVRSIACFLIIVSILSVNVGALGLSAQSAILIDAESGRILYESNGFHKMSMASTTKIMTAVVAIENMPLDTKIKIPKEATGIEGSSIYLCEGEILTLEQLLYALLLASANDAATAIALSLGKSIEGFAQMMNECAERIGLIDSHFENPHGLDSDNHYTTASDLAKLTAYALTLPAFRKIVSTQKTTIPFNNTENLRYLTNHNKLLKSYQGAIGVKTGFTKKSGRCLVSSASRDGVTLIAVTLNAPNDWKDHTAMLDYGFQNYEMVELSPYSINLPTVSGIKATVYCSKDDEEKVLLPKHRGEIQRTVELYPFAYAPIDKGEILGEIIYFCDGKEIGRCNIVATESVALRSQKSAIWDKVLRFFKITGDK